MSAAADEDLDVKSPMKRIGSTRKLLFVTNIRAQLNEQLRWLDARVEAQVALAAELQEFFRRRAEVELDYSRGLDKLAKALHLRHKEQRNKREQWPLFSSYACWQQLVAGTRALARDHAALADLHSAHLVARLATVMEDVQRVYRRCREIAYESHEEILRVLHELHAAMKTFQQYGAEWRAAEAKLRSAEAQRARLQPPPTPVATPSSGVAAPVKPASKKARALDKEVEKRKIKYTDAKLKALKARNEYLLCLEASNTTIHKYFVDDLSDLIDCMDLGFHNCISRALRMQVSADEGRARALQQGADALTNCISALDSRLDKQKFLEAHHQAFVIPKKITFQGQQPNDDDCEVVGPDGVEDSVSRALRGEMETRLAQLEARVRHLRTESDEVWKTLETAETTLLQMVDAKDWETSWMFGEQNGSSGLGAGSSGNSLQNGSGPPSSLPTPVVASPPAPKQPEQVAMKARADRHETEDFYLTKFREYLLGSSRIARLEAKGGFLRGRIGSAARAGAPPALSSHMHPAPRHRKRIGRGSSCQSVPRLFAGSLEEYLEATGQELPLIVTSCIRVINLYGLHHQGIFRVSGSQVEIGALREWFERGADPLATTSDASDINSVAGVLKLYLRELREPLFPIVYFEHYMELAQLDSKPEFVQKMKEFVRNMPRCNMVLLRYLFAFLNHLSEFSEENMMDPWNLAICFGPTLIPVPDDKDQVQYQNQINDLIKNVIILHEEIFPLDGGPIYEKYQTHPGQEVDESPLEPGTDDLDSEASLYPSEDEGDGGDSLTGISTGGVWEGGVSIPSAGERPAQCWRREPPHTPESYTDIHIKDEDIVHSSSDSRRKGLPSNADSVENGTTGAASAFRRTRSPPPATPTPHTWPRQEVLLETTV
ncbi:SLIT-ROBO Rho GTPase-activating protein 1-like [Arctopsyche grandis]|uniref:SLIT-ROBO Rho GTPase-activating protein 1-like n=1 Tax=Arctopsyche grandis TaxID=121162 RepID=UPI00406D8BB8